MAPRQTSAVTIFIAVALLIGVGVLLSRIETTQVPPVVTVEPTTGWERTQTREFSLLLPPGWAFNELQGIDSYVGEFKGDGATLHFDYGFYSNPLPDESDSAHTVTYEMIGGYRAKVVVPKQVGKGTVGVYFDTLPDENKLEISGEQLTATQQATALAILRSLEFKK